MAHCEDNNARANQTVGKLKIIEALLNKETLLQDITSRNERLVANTAPSEND